MPGRTWVIPSTAVVWRAVALEPTETTSMFSPPARSPSAAATINSPASTEALCRPSSPGLE